MLRQLELDDQLSFLWNPRLPLTGHIIVDTAMSKIPGPTVLAIEVGQTSRPAGFRQLLGGNAGPDPRLREHRSSFWIEIMST